MALIEKAVGIVSLSTRFFDYFRSLGDLLIRIWLFKVFFFSGILKVKSWSSTLFLFTHEYDIPLLSPKYAALFGTGTEILFPLLMLLGLGARLPAFGLFCFNIIAVYGYRGFLLEPTGAAGLNNHILWGFLILVTMVHGHGKFSIDFLLNKLCSKYKY